MLELRGNSPTVRSSGPHRRRCQSGLQLRFPCSLAIQSGDAPRAQVSPRRRFHWPRPSWWGSGLQPRPIPPRPRNQPSYSPMRAPRRKARRENRRQLDRRREHRRVVTPSRRVQTGRATPERHRRACLDNGTIRANRAVGSSNRRQAVVHLTRHRRQQPPPNGAKPSRNWAMPSAKRRHPAPLANP